MSWAEPAAMDTLSELPPASVSVGKVSNVSRAPSVAGGRSKSSRRVGGASKSERRLLMEAKAGVGAAIAEVPDPSINGPYIWLSRVSIAMDGGTIANAQADQVCRELDASTTM